ncbi:MAG TPA: hypothetical protein VFG59_10335 [Anaeromyxobacter sp.]|nr:hypothetical protein [Anaeromyxobacter sp.]
MPPRLGSSLRLAVSAFRREAWLVAPGLFLTGVRRMASWPAIWIGGLLLLRAVSVGLGRPGSPWAALQAVLALASSPRFWALFGGLWLAGVVLAGALRVAWISGAVPVLGAAMAGQGRGAEGLVEGLAEGFAPLLPAALLALVLELSGGLFAGSLVLGTAMIARRGPSPEVGAAVGLAAAAALALTLALFVPFLLSTLADALLARAALLREGAATALAAVSRRFLARPGVFLFAALMFGLVAWLAQASVRATGALIAGVEPGGPLLLRLGPKLMVGTAAALLAGVVDLVWLGTLAVLTCGRER